jgi:hypothetical protein
MGFLKMYLLITVINVIAAGALLLVGALALRGVRRERLRMEERLRRAAGDAVKDVLTGLARAQADGEHVREAGAAGG